MVRMPPWHGPVAGAARLLRAGVCSSGWQNASSIRMRASSWSTSPPVPRCTEAAASSTASSKHFARCFPEERNLELVHRLDRDTSGCLLLAKQPSCAAGAARRISRRDRREDLRRTRSRRVAAQTSDGAGAPREVRHALRRTSSARGSRMANPREPNSRSWRRRPPPVVEGASAHRAHASDPGALSGVRPPVIGDEKYATERQLAESRATGVQRLCLHARSVSIPIAGAMRRFEAPLPADFTRARGVCSAPRIMPTILDS